MGLQGPWAEDVGRDHRCGCSEQLMLANTLAKTGNISLLKDLGILYLSSTWQKISFIGS